MNYLLCRHKENLTERRKLVPEAGILLAKFQLERSSRLDFNNGSFTRYF